MSAARNSTVQQIEDLEDERDDFAAMLARVESANQETIPLEIVKRLSDGEPPVQVWREHRRLTLHELATASGVDIIRLKLMELDDTGSQIPLRCFAAVARALTIDLDLLVPWTAEGEAGRLRD